MAKISKEERPGLMNTSGINTYYLVSKQLDAGKRSF